MAGVPEAVYGPDGVHVDRRIANKVRPRPEIRLLTYLAAIAGFMTIVADGATFALPLPREQLEVN